MATEASTQQWLLIYMPYLRLAETVVIGPWKLISSKKTRGYWPGTHVGKVARRFIAKHRTAFGRPLEAMTVVTRDGRALHDQNANPSDAELDALQAAVTIGVLCSNPGWEPDGDSRHVSTSDNCLLRADWVSEEMTWFADQRGSLVQTWGTRKLDRPGDVVAAPLELHRPTVNGIDEDVAAAAYEVITGRDQELAGRLLAASRWLSQAWANTPSISTPTRAVLVKTGFEALLGSRGAWSQATRLRQRFELVAQPYEGVGLDTAWSAGEEERHQVEVEGKSSRATDLQAWYMALARYRNAVVHGDADPADADYPGCPAYDGPLFWVGERVLRDLIRCELALATGQPLVFDGWRRATGKLLAESPRPLGGIADG